MTYKYEDFAEKQFFIMNRSGPEYMVRCIFHDDSRASMQFNIELGVYLCFGCGSTGNIKTIERFLGIRATESMIDVADIYAKIDALKNEEAEVLPILPETYLKQFAMPTRYWTDRGYSKKVQAVFELGYSPFGDHAGEFHSIPIRNQAGHLLGIIKRYTYPDAELKYKYPKGFHRRHNLFGSWLVERDPEAHTVALVEGASDAMKVWQAKFPALAIYGSSISPEQVRVLRRLGVRKVITFFDNDEAGEKAASSCMGWSMKKRGSEEKWVKNPLTDLRREFLVETVRYPARFPDDPGAMDSDQITQILSKTRKVF